MAKKGNVPRRQTSDARGSSTTKDARTAKGWLQRNWHTLIILTLIMFLALFVRAYYAYDLSVDNGYLLSGGSDAYQHERVIEYVMDTGEHLVFDPLLNYPFGFRNVRPPLYDWSVALSGMVLDLGGMEQGDAMGAALVMSTAIWGALTVIPVYLIGRQAFGNRAGILAALLFAIMAGHIQRSVLTNADHDSMVLFFGVWSFYFIMMSLSRVEGTKWVSDWKDRTSITSGFKDYFGKNTTSLIYALMGGVSLAAVAMIWKGFDYVLVIVLLYFLFQLFVDRFKGEDSMGTWLSVSTMTLSAMLFAAPVYLSLNFWDPYFNTPVLLCIGMFVLGLLFVVTRDYPWTLVLPSFVAIGLVVVGLLALLAPSMYEMIVTGFGYFAENKLYSTISEAQPPDFSTFVFAFGVLTFWFAVAGIAWAISKIPKTASPNFIFVVVWSFISVYMATIQARYLFNASPAFAVMAGWMLSLMIGWMALGEIPKAYASSKGSAWNVIKRTVKIRHVVGALTIAFLIVLPNAWVAVDAGIPSELKDDYDESIYNVMPEFLQPEDYADNAPWYLGAFSYSLPMPTTYWPMAWDWFSEQDTDVLPAGDRPAFLSWWDYGFEANQLGDHPTVADNYQNAYQFAGAFITAQGEDNAMALLIVRALEQSGTTDPTIVDALESHGVDVILVRDIMDNSSKYISIVLDDPDTYGPYDDGLSAINARYAAAQVAISSIGTEELAGLINDLTDITGTNIGYFAIDSRLFPFSALGYNIFYAPAKLSDHRIDPATNAPMDFFEIKAVDQYGVYHNVEDVTSDMVIVDYAIEYKEMFYDCMLYKAFMGFGPEDLGLTEQGIPGISGSLASYQPMQAWGLSNFRLVYKTTYYNPFPYDMVSDHPDAWRAIGYDEAISLQEQIDAGEIDGVIDASANSLQAGVVFIQYYDGAIVSGKATTGSGEPYENVWVTAVDEYGYPHEVVATDENGDYEITVPFGDVTLIYSYGDVDARTMVAEARLSEETFYVTYDQAMREEVDSDGDGYLDYLIQKDVSLSSADLKGNAFIDMDDDDDYGPNDIALSGATVILKNDTTGLALATTADDDGHYVFDDIPPMGGEVYAVYESHSTGEQKVTLLPFSDLTQDIPVEPATLSGTLVTDEGSPLANVELLLEDETSGTVTSESTDDDGMFEFSPLMSGSYTLSLNDSAYILNEQRFSLSEGDDIMRVLTVEGTMSVSGTVWDGSSRVQGAQVGLFSDDTAYWTTTDSRGEFSIDVPEDVYTLYAVSVMDGREVADLMTIDEGDPEVTLSMSDANELWVTLTYNGIAQTDVSVEITDRATGATVAVVTNADGKARVALPDGVYWFYAVDGSKAVWDESPVTISRDMGLKMVNGAEVMGTVFYDADGSGSMGVDEHLAGAEVVLTDAFGKATHTYTGDDGMYSVIVPAGQSYSLSVAEDGFEDYQKDLGVVSSRTMWNIGLSAESVSVNGDVIYDGHGLNGCTVTFQAKDGGAVTATAISGPDGLYSVQLMPGDYTVIVAQDLVPGDDSVQYQNSSALTVSVSEDVTDLGIEVERRVLTDITLSTDRTTAVTIVGPETVELEIDGPDEIYLMEGDYDVHATASRLGTEYAYLDSVTIDELHHSIYLDMDYGKVLTVSVRYDNNILYMNVPLTVTASSGASVTGTTSLMGEYSVILPSDGYDIDIDWTTTDEIGDVERYVTFSGEEYRDLSTDVRVYVFLDRELYMAPVTGTVTDSDGHPVAAEAWLTAVSETAIDADLSLTPTFDVGVAPGSYDVYITAIGGTDSYLGTVDVPVEGMDVDIVLEDSALFSGRTEYDGTSAAAEMTISGDGLLSMQSDYRGRFSVYLPKGDYQVNYSADKVVNGMDIMYFTASEVSLEGNTAESVDVAKVTERGLTVEWSQDPSTVKPGGKVTYTITVTNDGNTAEHVELSATTAWDVSFSPQELSLDFGTANAATVTVSIQTPVDAEVDHSPIYIKASSADADVSDTETIDVDISAVHGVEVDYENPVSTDGSRYEFSVKLTNTGNIDDTYAVSVSNVQQLVEMGWEVELVDTSGNPVTEVEVDAGKDGDIKAVFVASDDSPVPNAEMVIMAYSVADASEFATVEISPNIVDLGMSGAPSVSGSDINDQQSPVPSSTLVMVGLAIALTTMVILMAISRGVFSRRK